MRVAGRKSWARVGENRDPGEVDERGLSGPVTSYTLPPEELEKIFRNVKPEPNPEPSISKAGCRNKRTSDEDDEEIDLNEAVDIDEIERIESGEEKLDPAWLFDRKCGTTC